MLRQYTSNPTPPPETTKKFIFADKKYEINEWMLRILLILKALDFDFKTLVQSASHYHCPFLQYIPSQKTFFISS